jgi:hypothetical protein
MDDAVQAIRRAKPEDARAFASRLAESSVQQQITLDQLQTVLPQTVQPELKRTLEISQRSNLIAKVTYSNPEFLSENPSILDSRLERGEFELRGTLISIDDGTWDIGGVTLRNVKWTEQPTPGKFATIEGLSWDDKVYIIEIEYGEEIMEQVQIEGVFGGVSQDGSTWRIGGIPIEVQNGETLPGENEKLELSGVAQDHKVTVTQIENRENGEEAGKAELDGTLKGVDIAQSTITVATAGTQFTVNVGQASIRTEDGKTLQLSALASLVDKGIEVKDLYKQGDLLYAREVQVDLEEHGEVSGEQRQR